MAPSSMHNRQLNGTICSLNLKTGLLRSALLCAGPHKETFPFKNKLDWTNLIDHVSMNYCALLSSFNFSPLITSTSQTLLLSDATVKICLTLSLIYLCEVGFKYRHCKKKIEEMKYVFLCFL